MTEVDLICDHADDIEVSAEPQHDLSWCKTQEVSPSLKHMTACLDADTGAMP